MLEQVRSLGRPSCCSASAPSLAGKHFSVHHQNFTSAGRACERNVYMQASKLEEIGRFAVSWHAACFTSEGVSKVIGHCSSPTSSSLAELGCQYAGRYSFASTVCLAICPGDSLHPESRVIYSASNSENNSTPLLDGS